jgi:hypothetical protein
VTHLEQHLVRALHYPLVLLSHETILELAAIGSTLSGITDWCWQLVRLADGWAWVQMPLIGDSDPTAADLEQLDIADVA